MGQGKFFENIIDQRMKDLHTAYLAKVISVTGNRAKIQPLGLIKEYGGNASKQAVVFAPVAKHVTAHRELATGDIVVCIVCDRDITEALKGNNRTPPAGHHSLSDSVVIGVL